MTRHILIAIALFAGCDGNAVSPPPLGEYTAWHRVDTHGEVPGHGDTYRAIYVNDIARVQGTTAKDAVLVKEVRDNLAGEPGDLRSVAIMRKLIAGPSHDDEGGWLFTLSATAGGPEEHLELCWNRCHAQAPLAGVWLDYTQ